jgi:AraC-like DNA-binding protein
MKAYDIALAIGIFQGVILTLLLSTPRFRRHRLLAGILAIFTYSSFVSFLWSSNLIVSFPHLLGTTMPMMFLIGPLYFLYVRTVFGYTLNVRKDIVHAIPAILCAILIIPFFISSANEKLIYILSADITKVNLPTPRSIGYGLMMIHIGAYLVASSRFLNYLRPSRQKHFAVLKEWTTTLNIGLIFLTLSYSITHSIYMFTPVESAFFLDVMHLIITFFIHFVAYAMIYVLGLNSPPELSKAPALFTDIQTQALKQLTESQKVYLKPDLKMGDVARSLNLTPQKLSEIINSQYGKSFTDFINEYRVQEASRILRDKQHERYDLDGIAELCGFQNRTTLTRVFKKHTNLSPTQYRQLSDNSRPTVK